MQLCGEQGGAAGFDEVAGTRVGFEGHYGERVGARIHRNRHDGGVEGRGAERHFETDSLEPIWEGRRYRGGGAVSGKPGGAIHHGASADGGWRDGDVKGR